MRDAVGELRRAERSRSIAHGCEKGGRSMSIVQDRGNNLKATYHLDKHDGP